MPVVCYKPFSLTIVQTHQATWSTWFKVDSNGSIHGIPNLFRFSLGGGWGVTTIQVEWNDSNQIVQSGGLGSVTSPVLSDVALGQWHLLVVTWTSMDRFVRCYIDDVLRTTAVAPADCAPSTVGGMTILGGWSDPAANPAVNSWDEITFWNSTLFSAAQRSDLYAGGAGCSYPTYPASIPAPTACWKLDTSLTDSVLGITLVQSASSFDYQAGKFGQCVHKLVDPSVVLMSSTGLASLKIP